MDLRLLGEQIKTLRENANLSPNQLASQLGWRGPAPINRIEKGESRPNPETIERISKFFDVTLGQYSYYLGLAGYLPTTYLPPKSRLIPILEDVMQDIEQDPRPTLIRDYKHVLWGANAPMLSVIQQVGYTEQEVIEWMAKCTSSLDGVWQSESLTHNTVPDDVHNYLQQQIILFKLNNIYRQHEPFYKKYPTKMMILPEAQRTRFQETWENGNGSRSTLKVWHSMGQSYRRSIEHVIGLDHHFHVVRYIRLDSTHAPQKTGQRQSLCLWKIAKIDDDQLRVWSDN